MPPDTPMPTRGGAPAIPPAPMAEAAPDAAQVQAAYANRPGGAAEHAEAIRTGDAPQPINTAGFSDEAWDDYVKAWVATGQPDPGGAAPGEMAGNVATGDPTQGGPADPSMGGQF